MHPRQLRAPPTEHAPTPGSLWSATDSRAFRAGAAEPEGRGEESREGCPRACAASSRDPRFSMGFPICSSDLPERVAAAAGLGRRDSTGI